jgi:hypothetical protein
LAGIIVVTSNRDPETADSSGRNHRRCPVTHFALLGTQQAEQELDRCRLTGAVTANEAINTARPQAERDVVDAATIGIGIAQTFGADDGVLHNCFPISGCIAR